MEGENLKYLRIFGSLGKTVMQNTLWHGGVKLNFLPKFDLSMNMEWRANRFQNSWRGNFWWNSISVKCLRNWWRLCCALRKRNWIWLQTDCGVAEQSHWMVSVENRVEKKFAAEREVFLFKFRHANIWEDIYGNEKTNPWESADNYAVLLKRRMMGMG